MRSLGLLRHEAAYWAAIGLVAAVAILAVVLATPHGPQVYTDSFYYLTGSEGIAAFRGFGRISGGGDLRPITRFAPFFSVSMAALQSLGVERLDSAYWINLCSYALLIFAAGALVRWQTGSKAASLLGILLLGLSPVLLSVHLGVMSEPLFLALSLAAIILFHRYLSGGPSLYLVGTALLLGLTVLTRYAALALIATVASVLALESPSLKARVQRLVALLGISLAPMGLWIAGNVLQTGSAAGRAFGWHPVGIGHLRRLTLNVLEWFVPHYLVRGALSAFAWLLLLGGVVVASALAIRSWPPRTIRGQGAKVGAVLGLFIPIYLGTLAVSLSLFDRDIPVDFRILAPVYVAVMLLFSVAVYEVWDRGGRATRIGLSFLIAVLLGWNAAEQFHDAAVIRRQALNYPPSHVAYSPTIEAVRALPPVPLITNSVRLLYLAADRYAYSIPWIFDSRANAANPTYASELAEMRRWLHEECAALVLFQPDEGLLPEQAPLSDLTAGLVLISQYGDGAIYRDPVAEQRCDG